MQFESIMIYDNPAANEDVSLSESATHVFGTAGTYNVGWCGLFYGGWTSTIPQVYLEGWAQVTN